MSGGERGLLDALVRRAPGRGGARLGGNRTGDDADRTRPRSGRTDVCRMPRGRRGWRQPPPERSIVPPVAPPVGFRTFVARLREGLVVAHPDMPTFRFNRQEASAVAAYLLSIRPSESGK